MSILFRRSLLLCVLCGLALPAPAADTSPHCRYQPIGSLPVIAVSGGTAPAVAAAIDGKPAVMLLETGLAQTTLTQPSVEKFGLRFDDTAKRNRGAHGAAISYRMQIEQLSIGPMALGRSSLPVLTESAMASQVDGIVGADLLLGSDMEIALADKQFRFFRGEGCDNAFLGYWDKDAMVIPFGGTQFLNPNPRFMVELNGLQVEANISSGAPTSHVSRKAAERASAAKPAKSVGTFSSFTIGSETIKNATIDISDDAPQGDTLGTPDVVLGADFLRAHRVLFAMGQRRLYVSYVGGEVFTTKAAGSP